MKLKHYIAILIGIGLITATIYRKKRKQMTIKYYFPLLHKLIMELRSDSFNLKRRQLFKIEFIAMLHEENPSISDSKARQLYDWLELFIEMWMDHIEHVNMKQPECLSTSFLDNAKYIASRLYRHFGWDYIHNKDAKSEEYNWLDDDRFYTKGWLEYVEQ